MQKSIALSLFFAVGIAPCLHASPEKVSHPDYVISLYSIAKSCHDKLVSEGFSQSQMNIGDFGVGAEFTKSTPQFNGDVLFETKTASAHAYIGPVIEQAKKAGDDRAALYYKVAIYAKEVGDADISLWFTRLLTELMAPPNPLVDKIYSATWTTAFIMFGGVCAVVTTKPKHFNAFKTEWRIKKDDSEFGFGSTKEEVARELATVQEQIANRERQKAAYENEAREIKSSIDRRTV